MRVDSWPPDGVDLPLFTALATVLLRATAGPLRSEKRVELKRRPTEQSASLKGKVASAKSLQSGCERGTRPSHRAFCLHLMKQAMRCFGHTDHISGLPSLSLRLSFSRQNQYIQVHSKYNWVQFLQRWELQQRILSFPALMPCRVWSIDVGVREYISLLLY